ncbi:MAG: hypothetical protein AVDCRST_MAG12-3286, partial [uncultured Rubrobacteraceae bacterium]
SSRRAAGLVARVHRDDVVGYPDV